MKLHPATNQLIDDFSQALKNKLAEAEEKYGYTNGWLETGWMDDCRAMLMEHVGKGDPRDVAAYCAFLWYHGELTCSRSDALGLKPLTPEDSDPSGYVLPRALREVSKEETTARRTAEYWKAELSAANVEIERLRAASPSDTPKPAEAISLIKRAFEQEKQLSRNLSYDLAKFLRDLPGDTSQGVSEAEGRLRYALEQMVARTWGLEPAASSDGCYTDEPLERLARAALVDGP